jgi:hypothetical protein
VRRTYLFAPAVDNMNTNAACYRHLYDSCVYPNPSWKIEINQDDRIRPELKWEEGDGHVVLWQGRLVRDHGAISMDDTDQPSSPTVPVGRKGGDARKKRRKQPTSRDPPSRIRTREMRLSSAQVSADQGLLLSARDRRTSPSRRLQT